MKALYELIAVVFVMLFASLVLYFSWNAVAPDFDFINSKWHHLGFWQLVGIVFVIRTLTGVVRTAGPTYCRHCKKF